jgi:hypothetical protein
MGRPNITECSGIFFSNLNIGEDGKVISNGNPINPHPEDWVSVEWVRVLF